MIHDRMKKGNNKACREGLSLGSCAVPDCPFYLGSPYQNRIAGKKGTLIIKGLLRNLVLNQ